MYIGGMHHAGRDVPAPRLMLDPPGTIRDSILQSQKAPWWIGVLVEEREADVIRAVVDRHVDDSAHPKAEQNSLLHPRDRAPHSAALILFRRAHLSRFESIEKPSLP